MDRDDILDALDKDGATYDLEDGRTLRLSIQPEEDSPDTFWSDECYGAISGYQDHIQDRRHGRPAPFDGNAEKIDVDRGGYVWWQPPADVKRGTEVFTKQRRLVRDLLEMGFYYVLLELTEGRDAYGRPIVRRLASLGGIEPQMDDGYLRELVDDLLGEIEL